MGKMAEIVFDLDLFDEGTSAPKPIPQKKEKETGYPVSQLFCSIILKR